MSDAQLRALERAAESDDLAAVRLVLERLRRGLPLAREADDFPFLDWVATGNELHKMEVLGSWLDLASDEDWNRSSGRWVGRCEPLGGRGWFYAEHTGATGCDTCGWGGSHREESVQRVSSLDELALLLPQDFVRTLLAV